MMRWMWRLALGLAWAGSLYGLFQLGRGPEAPAPVVEPPAMPHPTARPAVQPDLPPATSSNTGSTAADWHDFSSTLVYAPPGTYAFDAALGQELWALEALNQADNELDGYFLSTAMANSLDAPNTLAALDWLEDNPPPGSEGYRSITGHLSFRLGQLLGPEVIALAETHPGLDLENALIGWSSTDPAAALTLVANGGLPESVSGYWAEAMREWAIGENPGAVRAWIDAESQRLADGRPLQGNPEALVTTLSEVLSKAADQRQYADTAALLVRSGALYATDAGQSFGDSPEAINGVYQLAQGWLAEDPAAAQAFLANEADYLPPEMRRAFSIGLITAHASSDPARTWSELPAALDGSDASGDYNLYESIGQLPALRTQAPDVYVAALRDLADNAGSVSHEILTGYFYDHPQPAAAFAELQSIDDPATRRELALAVSQSWLEADPETARPQLMYQPDLPAEVQQALRSGAPLWQVREAMERALEGAYADE